MKLIAAAVKFCEPESRYPQIMTATRHADVYFKMHLHSIKYDKATAVEGFLTDDNRFVDRHEAKAIAIAANQLIVPIEKTFPALYSEDVW